MFETILRCKLCGKEFKDGGGAKDHFKDHIRRGDTFSASCRFGEGVCTNEQLCNDCISDPRMKNNWMCWRDGILVSLGVK